MLAPDEVTLSQNFRVLLFLGQLSQSLQLFLFAYSLLIRESGAYLLSSSLYVSFTGFGITKFG